VSGAGVAIAVALCVVTGACGASPVTAAHRDRPALRTTTTTSTTTTTTAPSTTTTLPRAPVPPPTTAPPPAVTSAGSPCGTAAAPAVRYSHVVWIWMENHAWGDVIGTPSAPYLTGLAHACATATNWSVVGSPSLPNYLGATSGSTWGVADDADPGSHPIAADNLFRQVRAAGGSERSFVESMPANCEQVSQGDYAAKHNPAAYYTGGSDRAACQADDVPLSELPAQLAAGTLPTFTSISPNICDDMHDCSVGTGDQWLSTWVPQILDSPAYRSGTTAVFVVFDEYSPLANVVIAPSVRPGTVSGAAVSHYSLLRATEEMLGLPLLGAAASAPSLRAALGI
jgi:hypothetical protein